MTLLLGGLATSCGLVPEHPGDDVLVLGFRVREHTVEIKVPMCAGEKISRVEVWDPGDDRKKEKRLWWGQDPLGATAGNGQLELWSPTDYRKVSKTEKPASFPALVDVSADFSDGESVGDLVDLDEAAKHQAANKYWTIKGKYMSAKEIDEQLSCRTG
ncbi:hypothetical protein AB0L71_20485 [Streptomyces sp. NPDC052052]|uniref:hypothetical protein n=1 Tax=Streptomyces sp. NPDC052052 TaxID=3154756 RepID=UPI003439A033